MNHPQYSTKHVDYTAIVADLGYTRDSDIDPL